MNGLGSFPQRRDHVSLPIHLKLSQNDGGNGRGVGFFAENRRIDSDHAFFFEPRQPALHGRERHP